MQIYFSTIHECLFYNTMNTVFESEFDVSNAEADSILSKLRMFLKNFREDIAIIIETKYVDKVYRDTYYSYYSTKLKLPPRECIRISLFDLQQIQSNHLYNTEELSKIKDNYLGFIVIRPIWHNPIGRNVISPKALNRSYNNMKICSTGIESSTFGFQLVATGFPHSSQDTEIMTCAETTIWSLMEYFGNKYPEYKPVLPSKILKILERRVFERQIPSHGLIYEDISYTLKQQGFGTVAYSREKYKEDFKKIFTCYIESGIPVVVLISNERNTNHALLCVGRIDITSNHYDHFKISNIAGKNIYEWNHNVDEFVFIDDNMPPYQRALFSCPTKHYDNDEWNSCEITHFIVPLYPKIYMESDNAIQMANNIALNIINIKENSVIKTFLTSSRLYRNYIINNQNIEIELKNLILRKDLPKYVWITEISTIEHLKNNKIIGNILIDATATKVSQIDFTSLIFACYEKEVYVEVEHKLKKVSLNAQFYCNTFDMNLMF